MSVRIGVYDFFSYTLPGALFLLWGAVAYELWTGNSVVPGLDRVDLAQVALIAVASFLLGHLMDPVSWRNPWYWLFGPRDAASVAHDAIVASLPGVQLGFQASDWPILEARIALDSDSAAAEPQKLRATHIMLRSTCLALLLFALLCLVNLIAKGWQEKHLVGTVVALGFSAVAARGSHKFSRWSYNRVFELAIAHSRALEPFAASEEADSHSATEEAVDHGTT